MPVKVSKLVPVFRLYTSASYLSLQGNTSPGAKWQEQHFIFRFSRRHNFVCKPDGNGNPENEGYSEQQDYPPP